MQLTSEYLLLKSFLSFVITRIVLLAHVLAFLFLFFSENQKVFTMLSFLLLTCRTLVALIVAATWFRQHYQSLSANSHWILRILRGNPLCDVQLIQTGLMRTEIYFSRVKLNFFFVSETLLKIGLFHFNRFFYQMPYFLTPSWEAKLILRIIFDLFSYCHTFWFENKGLSNGLSVNLLVLVGKWVWANSRNVISRWFKFTTFLFVE